MLPQFSLWWAAKRFHLHRSSVDGSEEAVEVAAPAFCAAMTDKGRSHSHCCVYVLLWLVLSGTRVGQMRQSCCCTTACFA